MNAGVDSQAKLLVEALPHGWPQQLSTRFESTKTEEAKALLAASPEVRAAAVFHLLEMLRQAHRTADAPAGGIAGILSRIVSSNKTPLHQLTRTYGRDTLAALLRSKLPFSPDDGERLFQWLASGAEVTAWSYPIAALIAIAES